MLIRFMEFFPFFVVQEVFLNSNHDSTEMKAPWATYLVSHKFIQPNLEIIKLV